MLLGVGLNYRFGVEDTDSAVGLQLRLGFHSGVRIFVPPPPPPRIVEAPPPPPVAPPPPPPAPAPAPNRQPTVKAECDPCKVEVGQSVTLRAISQDPDGDALSARWTVPAGTIADARAATTQWRAETAPGTLTFTVTAEDSRGGTASSNVTVEVIGASVQALGDIQFDLDQSVLRPDAMSILAIALKALNDAPARRLHIEGYASDDGDAEYNRQLGERRAGAVRDYLVSQGINATRITTFSFGEERPKYDTSQEATRRLNRRAALVLR
jgi:peptidoglycan-associated lipoprotein